MSPVLNHSGEEKMKLELGKFPVEDIRLGDRTEWRDGILEVDTEDLRRSLRGVPGIAEAEFEVARPGDNARIVHLLDAVSPRVKVGGKAEVFPGQAGRAVWPVGSGRTHELQGMAVLGCCEIPWRERGGLLMVREGIIDMTGRLAPFSPFSGTVNLVVSLRLAEGLEEANQEEATRSATLRAAGYLAGCLVELEPPSLETRKLDSTRGDLPRVVYVNQIQSQGLWARSFFYGYPLDQLLPTQIHPNELADGALVSGNQVYQCFKIPTWLQCNNPIVENLYSQHGTTLDFGGAILSRGHFYSNELKDMSANLVARLAGMMGADGIVLTWEGGGNSAIDAMKTLQACERRGIATTAVAYELAGAGGDQDSLLGAVPEADALVSAGSTDEPIRLPSVDKVLGGDKLRLKPEVGGVELDAAGSVELENLHEIYCAGNQLGAGRVRCEEF